MSVLIATSLGDIVIDLHTDRCPLTTKNFLKLCKIKYFNGCLFHTIQKDFTAQTGDPTGQGTGGDSIYKFLYGEQARFFGDEIQQDLKHSKTGTVAMASAGENLNASQFYFTLRDDLDYLDGKHTVFGEVAEGLETLTRINEAYVDEKNRPYKNIRIKHTYILDDPFDDPPQLAELIPDASPEGKPQAEIDDDVRLEDDWVPMDEQLGTAELEEVLRAKEAHSRAVVLESIGDIPDAEVKPPENVLFVCKLNPVTEDEDLNTIFSRFGTVVSAEVIRDYKTGDSLCYAFIEFETNEACEQAYFKMDNALIDDRRIHVDFSQSVAKLWSQYRRKEHQTGKGRGCFKCGALDHIAKDCTGDADAKPQTQKYILKDGNSQRGGNEKSTYEMVFDGDSPENLDRDKRQREQESENEMKRRRIDRRSEEDMKERDRERRDYTSEKSRHSDRNRGHREDVRNRGSHNEDTTRDGEKRDYRSSDKNRYYDTSRVPREDERNCGGRDNGSRRDVDNAERLARDKGNNKKHGGYEDRMSERDRRNNSGDGGKKNDRDYRNSEVEGTKRGERDLRHGDREGANGSEKDYRKSGSEGGKSSGRDYRKDDIEGGKRSEGDYRKNESERDKRGERDYRKSNIEGGKIEKGYRKNEVEGGKRSERDYRKTDREDGRSERR